MQEYFVFGVERVPDKLTEQRRDLHILVAQPTNNPTAPRLPVGSSLGSDVGHLKCAAAPNLMDASLKRYRSVLSMTDGARMSLNDGWMAMGDSAIARVVEWLGPIVSTDFLLPETPTKAWKLPHIEPARHREPKAREWIAAMQTWVVRTPGSVVLIDTGVGNGRDRPQAPRLAHLNSSYLEGLAALGVEPDNVDVVVTRTSTTTTWAGTPGTSKGPGCLRSHTPATSCRGMTTRTSTPQARAA